MRSALLTAAVEEAGLLLSRIADMCWHRVAAVILKIIRSAGLTGNCCKACVVRDDTRHVQISLLDLSHVKNRNSLTQLMSLNTYDTMITHLFDIIVYS